MRQKKLQKHKNPGERHGRVRYLSGKSKRLIGKDIKHRKKSSSTRGIKTAHTYSSIPYNEPDIHTGFFDHPDRSKSLRESWPRKGFHDESRTPSHPCGIWAGLWVPFRARGLPRNPFKMGIRVFFSWVNTEE